MCMNEAKAKRKDRKFSVESKISEEQNPYKELSEEQLKKLDALILESNNEREIYRYAIIRKKLSNPEAFEDKVAQFHDIFRIISYAKLVEVKDIDKLTNAVINRGHASEMNRISEVKGVDVSKVKRAIFQTDDVYEIIKFCHNHQDEADIITQEDIEKVEQMAIDSKKTLYMRVCGAWIKGVNIPRLQKEVENSKEPVEMYYFAREVKGANIDNLRIAIKKTGRSMYRDWFIEQFGNDKKPWFCFRKK